MALVRFLSPLARTAVAALVPAALAQGEEPSARFEARTEVIQVEVRVTTKGGERVLDLARGDFVLLEDGKPQVLTHFAAPPPLDRAMPGAVEPAGPALPEAPATREPRGRLLVLAVDGASLDASTFLNAKRALLRFVDQQVHRDDQVAVVTTGGVLLQPFTSDPALLREAVERWRSADLKASPFAERPEMSTYQADLILRNDRGAIREYAGRLLREDPLLPTQMVEAITNTRARRLVAEAARNARTTLGALEGLLAPLAELPQRKALILVSNGFFTGEGERGMLQAVTAAAARAGVVIYPLDARGLTVSSPAGPIGDASVGGRPSILGGTFNYAWLGFEADRNGLNALARDTGGLPLFDADLGAGLGRALADSGAAYVLGYEPASPAGDERYHRIEVRVPGRSGLEIRAHRGFFGRAAAGKRAARFRPASGPPGGRLRDVLLSMRPPQDLPIDLSAGYADTAGGGTLVIAAGLSSTAPGVAAEGTGAREVEVLGVIHDEEGRPVANFHEERSAPGAVTFDTHTGLPPGRYQVRVAARAGSRYGSAALWTRVPDLATGALTLTDLFVAEGDGPPRPGRDGRTFSRRTSVEFTLFACNARGDTARHADVAFEATLLSGGRSVVQDPPFLVTVPAGEPRPPRVGFSRSFALPALEPGGYLFRVEVLDRIAGVKDRRELSFRVD